MSNVTEFKVGASVNIDNVFYKIISFADSYCLVNTNTWECSHVSLSIGDLAEKVETDRINKAKYEWINKLERGDIINVDNSDYIVTRYSPNLYTLVCLEDGGVWEYGEKTGEKLIEGLLEDAKSFTVKLVKKRGE